VFFIVMAVVVTPPGVERRPRDGQTGAARAAGTSTLTVFV
jgi:hypothetical protein